MSILAGMYNQLLLHITYFYLHVQSWFSGVDYVGSSMLLTLNPEDTSVPVPVSIISDMILEGNEIFLGSLSIPVNPPLGLGPSATASTTTINILDDECM